MKKKFHTLNVLALAIALSAFGTSATTFTVINTDDAGTGSLRAAIESANAEAGNTISFATTGTIVLSEPLPDITKPMTIDGATAPGFSGTPLVSIDFNGNSGLHVARGAEGSTISSLSLIYASARRAAITLQGGRNVLRGNYIGLEPDGTVAGNSGDGVRILAGSNDNLIGNDDPVSAITYYDTSDPDAFTIQPVTGWQGIRGSGASAGEFLISGTSNSSSLDAGLLYIGPLSGGGQSYLVEYPGRNTIATSVYGPDSLGNGKIRLVGSYRKSGSAEFNFGFVWEGTVKQLHSHKKFRTIAYPGATYQFTHSTMGRLAVGNADGPALHGHLPVGGGKAYIYDVISDNFVTNIVFPKSKSNTAYGIWQNGPNSYTICGGYSPLAVDNLQDPGIPLTQGKGFLVDYDFERNEFSNWTSFDYPNGPIGVNFVTHFEGISSVEPGVYTLSADSVQAGSTNPAQGSWVSVRRNSDGSFDRGTWVDLNFPNTIGSISSSNSVYGNNVVGLVIGPDMFSFQAEVSVEFQLSNVISGNRQNGVVIDGSGENAIAMNYIGTDPAGSTDPSFGNGANGILVTNGAFGNLIGGQAFGVNNPTGSKMPENAVFQRPPQGNLISGNAANGVLINGGSAETILSGNYIGTDADGTAALGNGQDGVLIDSANNNSLIGCTFYQNPFVFYNVIGGNRGQGVRVNNSDNVTLQANFFGIGANNATSVPNGRNGLLVSGSSRQTQVGGVIPLGNVISGNTRNGIEVRDTVSGFLSFNTFGGIAAFQPFPSPNGRNGILITATGGDNEVRTCIVSGNRGNGIEIGGNASGVQITDTSIGTDTSIMSAIPNQGNGIVIRGTAHKNEIGGFQPSVEPTVFVSGNKKIGILITDGAHDNRIYHSNIGIGVLNSGAIPNEKGGIYLDRGTSRTTIGGKPDALGNVIQSNYRAGLVINSSTRNTVFNNIITDNSRVGIFAFGRCNHTIIKKNTVTGNGRRGENNVNISQATGIRYIP